MRRGMAVVSARRSERIAVPMFAATDETTPAGLAAIVSRLGKECPWTKKQDTHDMIYHARKELLEVEDVFRSAKRDGKGLDTHALTKELGDVLFDVMMMIEVTSREHPAVTLEACTASACQKVRKRCPYIFGGARANTIEEAEAAW